MDYDDEMTRQNYFNGCDLLTGEAEEKVNSCHECYRYEICIKEFQGKGENNGMV